MKCKSSFSPFTSRSKPGYSSETAHTFSAHFILYRNAHWKEVKWRGQSSRWTAWARFLSRNQDGKHGDVLSPPTLLESISSPLAGNHSWMLYLWLSPTPFPCSRTLKCKLQIQPEEKLPPRACNCFQIRELTSKSKKAGLSKFSFLKGVYEVPREWL